MTRPTVLLLSQLSVTLLAGCDQSQASTGAPAAPSPSLDATAAPTSATPSTPTTPATPPVRPPAAVVPVGEARESSRDLVVYARPSVGVQLGIVEAGEAFRVLAKVGGPGCDGDGWAEVEGHGYVCLAGTQASTDAPEMLPRLIPFDPPDPSEWESYVATGLYSRDPVDASQALLPFIYGKPWRHWKGPLYASLEAYERGDQPIGQLGHDHKYHFEGAVDSAKGTVLVRADGQVSPADQVFMYPVSRFHGRDLVADPVPAGTQPAWAVAYAGCKVYKAPTATPPDLVPPTSEGRGEPLPGRPSPEEPGTPEPAPDPNVGAVLPFETPFVVEDTPATPDGRWWKIPDGLGQGVPGYVYQDFDYPQFRHPEPLPRPTQVADGAMWIDVNVHQQLVEVFQGDAPIYATLVSTGLSLATPLGLYQVTDKSGYGDMQGRADASYDPYFVENVPWVMHFAPRYALHGVFWHWGFGHTASHGCVNLAPLDARWFFDHIAPHTQPGWITAFSTTRDAGPIVRVRKIVADVPDRRGTIPSAD